MLIIIALLALSGFLLSSYSWYIEQRIKSDATYRPACDISKKASCSKPIMSKYGSLFYISNSVLGVAFYGVVFLMAIFGYAAAIFYASVASLFATLFLAYILYAKIQTLCLICTTIYIINILLFCVAFYQYYFIKGIIT